MTKDMTLNETLSARGLTARPARFHGKKEILNSSGDVVFTGNAHEVWTWLRQSSIASFGSHYNSFGDAS